MRSAPLGAAIPGYGDQAQHASRSPSPSSQSIQTELSLITSCPARSPAQFLLGLNSVMVSFWTLLCCPGWPQTLLLLQSTEGWFHKLLPWNLGILFLRNPMLALNLPCSQGLLVNLIFFLIQGLFM